MIVRNLSLHILMLLSVFVSDASGRAGSSIPSVTSVGRELVRGEVLPYNAASNALMKSLESSAYLQLLDGEWQFKKVSDAASLVAALEDQSGWGSVVVPQSAPFKTPIAIYRREYKRPFTWVDREMFLHVGAVNSPYEIYVNGVPCGYNQSARVAAEFDVSRLSVEGNNTLAIVVFADAEVKAIENHAPAGDAMIEGNVYVMAQPKVRVRDFIAETVIDGSNGLLNLGVILKSHLLNTKQVEVYYDLYAPDGELVANNHKASRFEMKLEDTVRFFANIPNIKPWNHETPNLYTLQVKTQYEGRFSEYLSFRIGFRTVELKNGTLLINAGEFPLYVVEYSQDRDPALTREQLIALKDSGVNAIKVTSSPQNYRLYDMCNMLGIYVCDQADIDTHLGGESIKKGANPTNNPTWEQAYVDRVLSMYHASKGNPSVVIFSLAENAANGYNLYEAYLALKSIEHERPVIYSGAKSQWNSDYELPTTPVQVKQEPMVYVPADGKCEFKVTNNYFLTPIKQLVYTIRSGSKLLATGKIATDISPQNAGVVAVPLGKIKMSDKVSIELSLPETGPTYMQPKVVVETPDPKFKIRKLF